MILFVLRIDKQFCRLLLSIYRFLFSQRSNDANVCYLSLVMVLFRSKFSYVIELLLLQVINISLPLRADIC